MEMRRMMRANPKKMSVLLEYYAENIYGKRDTNDWLGSPAGISSYCIKSCPHFCKKCVELETSRPERDQHSENITICWCCKHSVPNKKKGTGCDWSIHGQCVKGSVRVKSDTSYIVRKCPQFERG